MKNQKISLIAFVSAAVIISGCNPLKTMVKRQNEVNYEVTPNPVEMHGDMVEITLKGSFPEKYFNKKVTANVVPVLVFGDQSEEFESLQLKGEVSEAEGTVINYEKGGSFSHTVKIPYKEGMEQAVLELRASGEYKGKTKELDPRKAADGTIITSKLVMANDKGIMANDNFQKFTTENANVEINYLSNSSVVRGGELNDKDIKELKSNVKTWSEDPKVEFTGMSVDAYASPEGEISKNDNLANERAASAAKAIESLLKRSKVTLPEGSTSLNGKGEDWDGFKQMMEASDIKDKDLIIRVLSTYTDLNKREQEIKNLAATYTQVSNKVLPKLRRSTVTLSMKHYNLSDDEIKALVDSKIDSLDVEQMLYAATLYTDNAKKASIYTSVTKTYPSDWRGWNNLGYIHLLNKNLGEAKTNFEKALGVDASNAIVNNNLGVIERLNGNNDGAMEYYAKASGAGKTVGENKAIIQIMRGEYEDAVSSLSGVNSFNSALANLLNGNNSIGSFIEGSETKNDAISYYLKAIAGVRSGDNDMTINNLKTATSKDAALKGKAKGDAEFIKLRENADFQSAVN